MPDVEKHSRENRVMAGVDAPHSGLAQLCASAITSAFLVKEFLP
jgi:hypothetical protein